MDRTESVPFLLILSLMSLSTSMAYLDRARGLIDKIASQELLIEEVAEWFAQTILSGRVVRSNHALWPSGASVWLGAQQDHG